MKIDENATVDDVFPSKWLKSGDLPDDRDLVVTIMDVYTEEVGQKKEEKFCISFREVPKHMICNVTNAKSIKEIYGKFPASWIGKRIALFKTEIEFAGDTTLAIRVRKDPPPEPQQQVAANAPEPAGEY